MSGFSPTWLNLREPIDAASRSTRLVDLVARRGRPSGPLRILDLGSGTGANLRYLAPRLGGAQEWLLIDKDRALLEASRDRLVAWAQSVGITACAERGAVVTLRAPGFECQVRTRWLDLAKGLEKQDLGEVQLVTASALLDLVSLDWLRALASYCHRLKASVLFALTYDGRICGQPADPMDERARELVNRHQLSDKGFGPALGPAAAIAVSQLFTELGYRMQSEPSDWHLGEREAGVQYELVRGWLSAAVEMAPAEAPQLQAWSRRRALQIEQSQSQLSVGHVDTAGWLP